MRSNGNKARLVFSQEGLHIDVAVRWQRVDSREVDEKLIVIAKNSKGEEVRFRSLLEDGSPFVKAEEDFLEESVEGVAMTKGWLNSKGERFDKSEVSYFQVGSNGQETPVEKLSKSSVLEVVALRPMTELENWKIEDSYTIWADEVKERGRIKRDEFSLYQFAKFLTGRDSFAVVKVSTGNSFKTYYGFIYPHYEDYKFALKMETARDKVIWGENTRGLMEICETAPVEVESVTKPKTSLASL